jgi:hypothetical protein
MTAPSEQLGNCLETVVGPHVGVRGQALAARLRSVDLHHPAARQAADAEGDVEGDRAGGDHLDRCPDVVAEPHDRALAELAVDVGEGGVEGLVAV